MQQTTEVQSAKFGLMGFMLGAYGFHAWYC